MQTRKQKLAEIALGLATLVPFLIGALLLADRIEIWACSSDAFFSGPTHPAIKKVAGIAAAVGLWLFTFEMLRLHVPFLRAFFREADLTEQGWLQPLLMWLSGAIGAISLVVFFAAASSTSCLMPNTITYRSWPWSDRSEYVWRDVVAIQTYCHRGSHTHAGYLLIMRDNNEIDLLDNYVSIGVAYPHLVAALKGVSFAFYSDVDARCDLHYADLLRRRPVAP